MEYSYLIAYTIVKLYLVPYKGDKPIEMRANMFMSKECHLVEKADKVSEWLIRTGLVLTALAV